MNSEILLRASLTLFLISAVALSFTYRYFHYSTKRGTMGREFHRNSEKPFVSQMLGLLSVDLLAAALTLLVISLFMG